MKHPVTVAQELFLLVGSLVLIAFVATFFAVEFTNITPATKAQTIPSLFLSVNDPIVIPANMVWTWTFADLYPNEYQFRYRTLAAWSEYASFDPTTANTRSYATNSVPAGVYEFQIRLNDAYRGWIESNVVTATVLEKPDLTSASLSLTIPTPVAIPDNLFWEWTATGFAPLSYQFRYRTGTGAWSLYEDFSPTSPNSRIYALSDSVTPGFYEFQIQANNGVSWTPSNVVGVTLSDSVGSSSAALNLSLNDSVTTPQDITWSWTVNGADNGAGPDNYEFRYRNPNGSWSDFTAFTPNPNGTYAYPTKDIIISGNYIFQIRAQHDSAWVESNLAATTIYITPPSSSPGIALSSKSPIYEPANLVWEWQTNYCNPAIYQFQYSDNDGSTWSSWVDFIPTTPSTRVYPSKNVPVGTYLFRIRGAEGETWLVSNTVTVVFLGSSVLPGNSLILDIDDPVYIPADMVWSWTADNFLPSFFQFRFFKAASGWSEYRTFNPDEDNAKTFPTNGLPAGYYEFQIRAAVSATGPWVESNTVGANFY